jgi:predicted RNase H-like HicB family nuclease
LLAYLCHFRPEREGGFTVTCPKLPLVVTFGESLEEPQANAREAIELCLECAADWFSRPSADQCGVRGRLPEVTTRS